MQTVKIDPFHLIGISIRTTNENGQATQEIAELWGRFLSENLLDKIPNRVNNHIYSLYTDYEGDETQPYTAILGCSVHSLAGIPEGMVGRSFNGGEYYKSTTKGDLMQGLIVNEWKRIWSLKLDRSYTADFELFGENAQNPNDAEVEFFVAVK